MTVQTPRKLMPGDILVLTLLGILASWWVLSLAQACLRLPAG